MQRNSGTYDTMQYVQGAAQALSDSQYEYWTQHQRHQNAYLTKFAESENTMKHHKHKSRDI